MSKAWLMLFATLAFIAWLPSCSSDDTVDNGNMQVVQGESIDSSMQTGSSFTENTMSTLSSAPQAVSSYVEHFASLDEEYEHVDREVRALQSEYNATVNAQMAAQDYADSPGNEAIRNHYEKKMDKLITIRQENMDQGLPVGPDIQKSDDINWVLKTLRQNFDVLSDKVSDLKKVKGKLESRRMKGY